MATAATHLPLVAPQLLDGYTLGVGHGRPLPFDDAVAMQDGDTPMLPPLLG